MEPELETRQFPETEAINEADNSRRPSFSTNSVAGVTGPSFKRNLGITLPCPLC